jgi:hydrogenase-4 component F
MTFAATGRTIFPMIWGPAPAGRKEAPQTFASALPEMVFMVVLIVLGLYIPSAANDLFQRVGQVVGGP